MYSSAMDIIFHTMQTVYWALNTTHLIYCAVGYIITYTKKAKHTYLKTLMFISIDFSIIPIFSIELFWVVGVLYNTKHLKIYFSIQIL